MTVVQIKRLQTKKIESVIITNSSKTAVLTEQEKDDDGIHIYKISISLDSFKDNEQTHCLCYGSRHFPYQQKTKQIKSQNNCVEPSNYIKITIIIITLAVSVSIRRIGIISMNILLNYLIYIHKYLQCFCIAVFLLFSPTHVFKYT